MKKDGKEYTYNFNGLRYEVFMKLAMIGAASILSKHKKPLIQWEKICQNMFGRERNYARVPKVVKAWAEVEKMPLETAIKEYKSMTKTDRNKLKARNDIKKQLLLMKMEELD